MATPESKNPLQVFPLTEHEFWYLRQYANGKSTSYLAREGPHSKTVDHASTSIRRKLAARTMAQAVWKAWDVGIEIPEEIPTNKEARPFLKSLKGRQQDALRMLAGGSYVVEIDSALGISTHERRKIIKGLYTHLPASSFPQIVFRATKYGFFNEHTPIIFSANEQLKAEDRLSADQNELLQLVAQGSRTYAEIAAELTHSRNSDRPISPDGVRSRLDGLRSKVAKLSGLRVVPPYQTVLRSSDLGIFLRKKYLDTHGLNPSLIESSTERNREELERAYNRVINSGEWVGTGRNQSNVTKRLREAYKRIGAKNPMQAVIMLHSLHTRRRGGRTETPSNSAYLDVPNGPSYYIPPSEVAAIADLKALDMPELIADLPRYGIVSAEVEQGGGKVVAILAGILKGDTRSYSPRSDDLTYPQLAEAYKTLASVLTLHPQIQNVESLLRLIEQRLKKLNSSTRSN